MGRGRGQEGHRDQGRPVRADRRGAGRRGLAQEIAADANKKYGGKFLRVTGAVGDAYDGLLHPPTQARSPGCSPYKVGIGYPESAKPGVTTGAVATFEGEFALVAALGPGLKDCKLVPPKKP